MMSTNQVETQRQPYLIFYKSSKIRMLMENYFWLICFTLKEYPDLEWFLDFLVIIYQCLCYYWHLPLLKQGLVNHLFRDLKGNQNFLIFSDVLRSRNLCSMVKCPFTFPLITLSSWLSISISINDETLILFWDSSVLSKYDSKSPSLLVKISRAT